MIPNKNPEDNSSVDKNDDYELLEKDPSEVDENITQAPENYPLCF